MQHLGSRWWKIAIVLIVGSIVLPSLVVGALVSLGDIRYVQANMGGEEFHDVYARRVITANSQLIGDSYTILEIATRLQSGNSIAQWALGRTAVKAGRLNEAVTAFTENLSDLNHNPVKLLDTLTTLSTLSDYQSIIDIWSRITPPATHPMISDTVALAYLRRARSKLASDDKEGARADLQQALVFRPFDLYANYYLTQLSRDAEAVTRYRQSIMNFSAEAVSARDRGTLDLVFEVFEGLVANDLWGPKRGANLVSYWIWQIPESQPLEHMLQELISQFPGNADWAFYLGELYDRRGQHDLAQKYYAQAAEQPAAAGTVIPPLTEATAPLTVGVASLLGVPSTQIQLGPNLSAEPFETGMGRLTPSWTFVVNQSAADWPYEAGRDAVEHQGSMRITDLWWPAGKHETGTDPFAQYETAIAPILTNGWVLSVWYRADGLSAVAGQVFLGTTSDAAAFVNLPASNGKWRQMVSVGSANREKPQRLILRNFGAANIWFQSVTVRPIHMPTSLPRCNEEVCTEFFQ